MARSDSKAMDWPTAPTETDCAPAAPLYARDNRMAASAFVLHNSDVRGNEWVRPAQGGLPRWRLKRVLDYVDDNLAHDISLDDLAGVARLSSHHFSDLFRQSMGTSPYRYVVMRRVECAKKLLRTSMLGVLDVALAVGFSDQSHFSKVFRRATGMTPGFYRASA
jgi:AraC family transcriptional regulator